MINQLDLLRHFYHNISIPETVFAKAIQGLSWPDASRIHAFVEQYVEVTPDKESGIVK